MKHNNLHAGFTLVEVIVAMTILSIMMISVMSIFISTNQLSLKTDINRSMQENVKNVVEKISEDVRINGLKGVAANTGDSCSFSAKEGNKLCVGNSEYYVTSSDNSGVRIDDLEQKCRDISQHCSVHLKDKGNLTNSSVSVQNLQFFVSDTGVPKVTMLITLRPAHNKGIKPDLIKNSTITVQTTISDRPLQTN